MKLPRSPSLSVVVISCNEGNWLRRTVENLRTTVPESSEIVVVDDGSEDDSAAFLRRKRKGLRLLRTNGIGVACARNYGARHASGDVLVFIDAHMRFEEGWWEPLVETLRQPGAGAAAPAVADIAAPEVFGYGFTLPAADLAPEWCQRRRKAPFRVPVLPGCCLAMTRPVFEKIAGFDDGLRSRGGVDAETGVRSWLLGYENWVVPASRVWHAFRRLAPYPVTHADVMHNRLRLALSHFNAPRVGRVIQALSDEPGVGEALLLAAASDVARRRDELLARRKHDDDWFFATFGLRW